MKMLLTTAFALFTLAAHSQNSVSNTKWKGQIQVPQTLDIVLEFRNDTLIASSAEGMELESMFFSQSKDTLKLRKLNGQSPCDYITEGLYRLEWADNGGKVILHMIKDDCDARAGSITSAAAYLRVKD